MKAKGFTLVEALVSLMISVTVLGAGIQSSRSGLRATQVASDQLLMSGLADEVVADLTVLRYSSTSSSPSGWKKLSDSLSLTPTSSVQGMVFSNASLQAVTCNPSCPPPLHGGPIILKWVLQKTDGYPGSDLSPVCTSWMPSAPICTGTSYGVHQDEIAVFRQTDIYFNDTWITSLSNQIANFNASDILNTAYKKEFFDMDMKVTPLSTSGLYTAQVTLTNHADPTIVYSRTQLLADTP